MWFNETKKNYAPSISKEEKKKNLSHGTEGHLCSSLLNSST